MRVLKFGGTSVGSAAALRRVVEVVAAGPGREVVVVASAMAGVTDLLVAAWEGRDGDARAVTELLRQRHLQLAEQMAPAEGSLRRQLVGRLRWLERQLEAAAHGSSASQRDAVLACGEQLLVPVLAAALRRAGVPAAVVDSRRVIVTDSHFGDAQVDLERTRRRVRRAAEFRGRVVPVVPGFSGADRRGRVTTLGRGGSDTTAAVLGAVLGARRVEIWTDVDGVLSAPPQLVPEARVVPHLSYQEAEAIAQHGGKVLHPRTMAPCRGAGVVIQVRNTFHPAALGTTIGGAGGKGGRVVCVTGCPWGEAEGLAVVALVGDEVSEHPGVVTRVFTALAEEGIPVRGVPTPSSPAAFRLLVDLPHLGPALKVLHRRVVMASRSGAYPPLAAGRLATEVCHG